MEVWRFQYIFPTGVYPLFLWELLAHGTAPVAAGIIVDGNTATVFAYAYVYSKGASLALPDMISSLSLNCGKLMMLLVFKVKLIKYILNGNGAFAFHDSPLSGLSKGLRMPRSVLLLTCRYTSVERGSTCPRRDWIYLMSTPFSNKWLAKL